MVSLGGNIRWHLWFRVSKEQNSFLFLVLWFTSLIRSHWALQQFCRRQVVLCWHMKISTWLFCPIIHHQHQVFNIIYRWLAWVPCCVTPTSMGANKHAPGGEPHLCKYWTFCFAPFHNSNACCTMYDPSSRFRRTLRIRMSWLRHRSIFPLPRRHSNSRYHR